MIFRIENKYFLCFLYENSVICGSTRAEIEEEEA